jgi:predicted  nucleic acid-binding Zn-ribbon protein
MVQARYAATALVYVTPELSRDVARNTVSEDMTRRMLAVQNAVLGPEYMRRMIEDTYGPVASEEQLHSRSRSVRNRVLIEPAATGAAPESLFAFNLTFRDTTAERAAFGANKLAELYIEQNKSFRTAQAKDALAAAEYQANRAKEAFEVIDRQVIAFREQHKFETGEHQNANITLFERRKDDLNANLSAQREAEVALQDQLRELGQAEIGAATTAEEIVELRNELNGLLVQYSEAHPSVIRVRRKLREAMAELGVTTEVLEPTSANTEEYPLDPRVIALRSDIATTRRQLDQFKARETKLRDEIVEYERRISAVATIQPKLSRLQAERSMLRERYEEAHLRAEQSRDALYVEETLHGERFELAARAEPPRKPFFPQPIRFYIMGIVAGCLLFVGPVLARRFLRPVVSSEAGLRALNDLPVLVTIPRVATAETRGTTIRRTIKNVALSTLCVAMTVTAFLLIGAG